jgi:HK97 gp10 family phage protein
MAIDFEGLDEVLADLSKIADDDAIKLALGRATLVVEDSAREKAIKGRTGDLAKFIESRVESNADGFAGIVFNPLFYAPYVEYGTGLGAYEEHGSNNGRTDVPWSYQDERGEWHTTNGMSPRPFMRPALDENRNKILDVLREGLKK